MTDPMMMKSELTVSESPAQRISIKTQQTLENILDHNIILSLSLTCLESVEISYIDTRLIEPTESSCHVGIDSPGIHSDHSQSTYCV